MGKSLLSGRDLEFVRNDCSSDKRAREKGRIAAIPKKLVKATVADIGTRVLLPTQW